LFEKKEIVLHHSYSGEEVLELLELHPSISLIILTVEPDTLNGFDVLKQIKIRRPEVPVFLISAHISMESLKLVTSYGCDELLQSPVKEKELMLLVNKYLYNLNNPDYEKKK